MARNQWRLEREIWVAEGSCIFIFLFFSFIFLSFVLSFDFILDQNILYFLSNLDSNVICKEFS